jgi:hypothetical protein
LDAWGEVEFGQYQMLRAVELKGNAARVHSGLIAQQINEIFKTRGLDAYRYGLLCYDAWEAESEKLEVIKVPVAPAVYEQVLVETAVYEEKQGERKLVKEAVYADGKLNSRSVRRASSRNATDRGGQSARHPVRRGVMLGGRLSAPPHGED